MREIENILVNAAKEEKDIPLSIKNRVSYTLEHKNRKQKKYIMRKLLTTCASLMLVLIGSVSVYAAAGGTISGKPVSEWLGIKFSDQYEEYVVPVADKELVKDGTSVKLVSTMCDDGFVVLEFDITVSDQDKKHLKLEESMVPEGYVAKDKEDEKRVKAYKDRKIELAVSMNNKPTENSESNLEGNDMIIDAIEHRKNYLDSIPLNNYNLIIDGKNYWIRPRAPRTITRISENEYKLYQMYFLTEKELGEKTEFTLTLDDIILTAQGRFGEGRNFVELDGSFDIPLSKNKAVQNSKVIIPEHTESTYKNMTKQIEKVIVTPLQTIVKVKTTINNASLSNISSMSDKDFVGLVDFKAYDETEKELTSCNYEVKRTITYENGKTEEWEPGDIATSVNFKNATMELTEYIIIEKKENVKKISLEPMIRQSENGKEKSVSLDKFTINLDD